MAFMCLSGLTVHSWPMWPKRPVDFFKWFVILLCNCKHYDGLKQNMPFKHPDHLNLIFLSWHKHKGIIPLRGTIGNITFYKSGDGNGIKS